MGAVNRNCCQNLQVCTYSHRPAWLSLWESCRRRRLIGAWQSRPTSPLRLRFAQTPLPRERQERMRGGKEILGVYLSNFAGKIQENRSGFLGRFKGVRGGIEIPSPNRKPAQRLRFGEEEMSTEDKRRRSRRPVPPWSFLTRQRFFWGSKRKCWTAPASL